MTPIARDAHSAGNFPRASVDNNGLLSPRSTTTERKRKASEPSQKSSIQRQKITRACDYCKEFGSPRIRAPPLQKKTRCTGTLPCMRCIRLSLSCEYTAAYSRGLPPEPPPAPQSVLKHATTPRTPTGPYRPASRSPNVKVHQRQQSQQTQRPVVSPRNSPEPVATDFEGNYLGPASGVSFINRVWRRLHQDETAAIPDEVQNESSKNTSVFMFGDKPYTDHQEANFTLPPFEHALEMVGIYFDFSIVTYRFLHRASVEQWVRKVYEDNISFANLPTGCMVARTAIVFMIFAVSTLYEEQQRGSKAEGRNESERWYAASKYIASMESGPPRLETIQARLGQCLYLLSSSRANECWYAFGTALQLVTALGLHRRLPAKLSKSGNTYLEQELRRRIFWSVYTLDKYLSVMFGRPRLLHDEDIDQELPDEINDDDMLQDDPRQRTGSADGMMIASVLHYRLGRILGEISRELYTVNPRSRDSPLETAVRLTSELEAWKESAPPIFNSVQASSLIPPLCRQSQVLQLAFSHAMIHATRSFLLNDFTDLSRRPPVPNPTVTAHVHKCIDAADEAMALVNSLGKQGVLIQSFWFTHYVGFCAIIVVYIYTIQQYRLTSRLEESVRRLFDLAESCQQHLAEATRRNCPSRRYSIILEELRLEVHRQISCSHLQSSPLLEASDREKAKPTTVDHEPPLDQNLYTSVSVDANGTNYMPLSNSSMAHLPSDFPDGYDASQDIGFLDNLEGSIWWAQLDSWAFSSIPSDLSTFNF